MINFSHNGKLKLIWERLNKILKKNLENNMIKINRNLYLGNDQRPDHFTYIYDNLCYRISWGHSQVLSQSS